MRAELVVEQGTRDVGCAGRFGMGGRGRGRERGDDRARRGGGTGRGGVCGAAVGVDGVGLRGSCVAQRWKMGRYRFGIWRMMSAMAVP